MMHPLAFILALLEVIVGKSRSPHDSLYQPMGTIVEYKRKLLLGRISAGEFVVMIISVGISLAFFTVIPDFVSDAVAALPATAIGNSTATLLNLAPFVIGAVILIFPIAILVKEFRDV